MFKQHSHEIDAKKAEILSALVQSLEKELGRDAVLVAVSGSNGHNKYAVNVSDMDLIVVSKGHEALGRPNLDLEKLGKMAIAVRNVTQEFEKRNTYLANFATFVTETLIEDMVRLNIQNKMPRRGSPWDVVVYPVHCLFYPNNSLLQWERSDIARHFLVNGRLMMGTEEDKAEIIDRINRNVLKDTSRFTPEMKALEEFDAHMVPSETLIANSYIVFMSNVNMPEYTLTKESLRKVKHALFMAAEVYLDQKYGIEAIGWNIVTDNIDKFPPKMAEAIVMINGMRENGAVHEISRETIMHLHQLGADAINELIAQERAHALSHIPLKHVARKGSDAHAQFLSGSD